MTSTALTIPVSRGAHLRYPYDLGTYADRKAYAALERATWVLYCVRINLARDGAA